VFQTDFWQGSRDGTINKPHRKLQCPKKAPHFLTYYHSFLTRAAKSVVKKPRLPYQETKFKNVVRFSMSYWRHSGSAVGCGTELRSGRVRVRLSIPVAKRSEARVTGRPLAETVGSNPAGSLDVCVVCVAEDMRTEDMKVHNGEKTERKKEKQGSTNKQKSWLSLWDFS
jgi:hypothetical protein